ncbi:MAG: helix-turn-helix domain-containing protein [Gammaproteobacteria bacterium]|nr:helix-turn-helix domain-containing protein [Gammaproteobacteria bacterium]
MRTLNIGIASYEQMKARTLAIARGERKVASEEPKVWFNSIESLAKVLSERNRQLLSIIAQQGPDSLTRLAELTGREKSNLSRTLKTMSGYGVIKLAKGERGTIVPEVPYDQLNINIRLVPDLSIMAANKGQSRTR